MNNESLAGRSSRAVRLAATVMLLRQPFEIYLLRRSGRSAFAPDAYVFPGGVVDEDDLHIAAGDRFVGADEASLRTAFRATVPPELPADAPSVSVAEAGALIVAAARELFEEAGILFASRRDGGTLVLDAHDRAGVRSGATTFAQFLESRDLHVDAHAFALFSHWITPPTEPRRYDTHFFVATAPDRQIARADAEETHDGIWIAPREALARFEAGTLHLVYPTIKHLERLAAFETVDETVAFAREKPIRTIMPSRAPSEGFVMPPTLEDAW